MPIKWLYKVLTKLECVSPALWLAVILQQLLSTLNLMMRSFKTEKVKMEVSKPSADSSLLGSSCGWRAGVGSNGIMLQPITVHFASASRQHQKEKPQRLSLLIMSCFKISSDCGSCKWGRACYLLSFIKQLKLLAFWCNDERVAGARPGTLGDVTHAVCTWCGFPSELKQKSFLFIAAFSSLSN